MWVCHPDWSALNGWWRGRRLEEMAGKPETGPLNTNANTEKRSSNLARLVWVIYPPCRYSHSHSRRRSSWWVCPECLWSVRPTPTGRSTGDDTWGISSPQFWARQLRHRLFLKSKWRYGGVATGRCTQSSQRRYILRGDRTPKKKTTV